MGLIDSVHRMKYDQLQILENAVASQHVRLEIDVPGAEGRGWKRTRSFADTQDDEVLNDQWCKDMQKGVSHILEETWVKASEAHYDAKLWPHVHPYGTGSVYSEPGAGGLHHHARNRLTNIQSWFRRIFQTRLPLTHIWFLYLYRWNVNWKSLSFGG